MVGKIKPEKILDQICNELLEGKHISNLQIEGLILTGSFVHGKVHKYSDIDLFVVVGDELGYIRHIVLHKEMFLIQLRVCSYTKFRKECLVYDRKRPAFFACKVLYDKNGICGNAIEQSKEYLNLGPKKLGMIEKTKLASTIKNEINTVKGLILSDNILAANLLINELVSMNVEYYNNSMGYWMTNNNYLFTELKEHNLDIYLLVSNIISNNDIEVKFSDLIKLCKTVIENFDEITGEYSYEEYL